MHHWSNKHGHHNAIITVFPHLNSKHFLLIITQLIYDTNLNELNVVSYWPGGPYDMFTVQNSSVGLNFDQTANGDAWLIGEQLLVFAD